MTRQGLNSKEPHYLGNLKLLFQNRTSKLNNGKQDIYIAKNYLNKEELDTLNRLVVIFLETAELRAKNRKDMTINFWKNNVDKVLEFNDKDGEQKVELTDTEKRTSKKIVKYGEFKTHDNPKIELYGVIVKDFNQSKISERSSSLQKSLCNS